MISRQKILLATTLLCGLPFTNISTATELGTHQKLSISSNNIFSITVTPNKAHGASHYTLKIYSHSNQKKPSINLVHPLRGQISNVDIIDIDNDSKDELIIETTYDTSSVKLHRDIFELKDKTLFDIVKQYLAF